MVIHLQGFERECIDQIRPGASRSNHIVSDPFCTSCLRWLRCALNRCFRRCVVKGFERQSTHDLSRSCVQHDEAHLTVRPESALPLSVTARMRWFYRRLPFPAKCVCRNLKGNSISSLVLTQAQFTILKRLSADSALGISSTSGSCASSATEDKVLDSVVCISESAATGEKKGECKRTRGHCKAMDSC